MAKQTPERPDVKAAVPPASTAVSPDAHIPGPNAPTLEEAGTPLTPAAPNENHIDSPVTRKDDDPVVMPPTGGLGEVEQKEFLAIEQPAPKPSLEPVMLVERKAAPTTLPAGEDLQAQNDPERPEPTNAQVKVYLRADFRWDTIQVGGQSWGKQPVLINKNSTYLEELRQNPFVVVEE